MTQHLIVLNKLDKLIDDLERDAFKTREETLIDLRDIRNELVHVNQTFSDLIQTMENEIDKNYPGI